jgi:hypothetical protein
VIGCAGCPAPGYCLVAGCGRQRDARPDPIALAAAMIARTTLLTMAEDGVLVAHGPTGRPVYTTRFRVDR